MILVGRMQKLQGYPPVSSHWQWNILIFNGEFTSNTSSKSPCFIASLSLPAQLTSRTANGLPLRSFEIGNSGFLDWKIWGVGRQTILICDCLKMWKQHQMFDIRNFCFFLRVPTFEWNFGKLPWYLYGVVCFWHTREISKESWFETILRLNIFPEERVGCWAYAFFDKWTLRGINEPWVQWKFFWALVEGLHTWNLT